MMGAGTFTGIPEMQILLDFSLVALSRVSIKHQISPNDFSSPEQRHTKRDSWEDLAETARLARAADQTLLAES